ncbi:hypothetical protein [Paraliomyxa miuraensis]|uniref:hypothetical protein n=1 Tax=Paraliomyxa miuraensis TaxID=376150 RepID=UPI002253AE30|nr:hypothetical protein [Paraliomyxa miuraensis]MCX4239346.1 hypothetical protein [Paraliomyxa miuraensis]
MRARARLTVGPCALLGLLGCGEGLPPIELELSKNCNRVEVHSLASTVGDGAEVVDVAADGVLGDTAWILLRREGPTGATETVVQRISATEVLYEQVMPISSPSMTLQPAAEVGQVWVVRDEQGVSFAVWRIAPDDPVRPLLDSEELSSFPTDSLCEECEGFRWPRRLIILPSGPALVSMPPATDDATLEVWVGTLDDRGAQIRLSREHELKFEPPCDGDTPEAQALCEMDRMNLRYPEVSLLGVQQDPRQPRTVLFGHRTRLRTYDGEDDPLESADVFMVLVFLDDDNDPAGELRSYSGFYDGNAPPGGVPPLPTADPPYGVAIDRHAAYGLFSNGGQIARLIQLPNADPEFEELSARVSLEVEASLLQLDRDLAAGRLVDGAWELTKLFPDDPSQSEVQRYEADEPITEVVSGGIGTFLLHKAAAEPSVVRVRCPNLEPDAPP